MQRGPNSRQRAPIRSGSRVRIARIVAAAGEITVGRDDDRRRIDRPAARNRARIPSRHPSRAESRARARLTATHPPRFERKPRMHSHPHRTATESRRHFSVPRLRAHCSRVRGIHGHSASRPRRLCRRDTRSRETSPPRRLRSDLRKPRRHCQSCRKCSENHSRAPRRPGTPNRLVGSRGRIPSPFHTCWWPRGPAWYEAA